MSGEAGYEFAAEVMDLCRLAKLPSERLPGLPEMNDRQRLRFDLSFARAAREKRLFDFASDQRATREDLFGTALLGAAAMREAVRS